MKALSSRKGITLVELMAIVVIIGIVATMALPRFTRTVNRLKFRTAARNMVSKLRLARSNAITNKQQFGVHVDEKDYTLTLFLDNQNPALFQFDNGDSVISVDTLPDGFVYLNTDYGNPAIVYRPNGSASNTGNILFMSYGQDDDVNVGSIQILASTGRTKLGSLNYY
jgi:Tfp pilus assembly protein FimT